MQTIPQKQKQKVHAVVADTAGWGCWPRLTCNTEGCNGATLVRQPYMDQERWEREKAEFLSNHPMAI